jgi:uncharacterized protein (DUF927 family)
MEDIMSKKSKPNRSNPSPAVAQVKIVGVGLDEWDGRYFKFSVKGSDRDIPPFSAQQLIERKQLFTALVDAGWNGLTAKTQNKFLEQLEARKAEAPTFKVVTRLGWNSAAYVFPDEIIGEPKMRLERAFSGLDTAMRGKYRVKGTLEEWQDRIAGRCVGN